MCLQKLEEMKADVDLLSPALRKHVDTLVMELTAQDALQLVYRAEDHAQTLSAEAQNLNRCVTSFRSSRSNHTEININNNSE